MIPLLALNLKKYEEVHNKFKFITILVNFSFVE